MNNQSVDYSQFLVEVKEQLFATKYKLYIPTEEELIREITQIRSLMRGEFRIKN